MDWVAEILWTEWQHSHGLRGNIPVDWVAEIRGIRSPEQEELFAALDLGSLAEQLGNRVLHS